MDEKALEQIEFHQETVSRDANSPLHLIREKEMEISGRVLAAKREAEELVATARRKAAESLAKAEDEAGGLAKKREAEVLAAVEEESVVVREQAKKDAATLEKSVEGKKPAAAAFLVDSVTGAH